MEQARIETPIGTRAQDIGGSAIGVARIDPDQSYVGAGELLQDYIDNANEKSWSILKQKIDYTYAGLCIALDALNAETDFGTEVRTRINRGQKLFFKPNLVIPQVIDPITHGPTPPSTACTEWLFMSALMRWFHDKLGISYHEMALGEAATAMLYCARLFTKLKTTDGEITTEAVIEGRSADFYGGWGFYFTRKYLCESLEAGANDNPMNGYEESVRGEYIAPGEVTDKLMVYDLNRLSDDDSKGREVEVPDGVNYKNIMLHKVIIGGDPADDADRILYPGCVLVNVPKFKVHAITLFTNVIKNLGIGLWPMQYAKKGGHQWNYSGPHREVPTLKSGIPHEVWVPELDKKTGITRKDDAGEYVVRKTGGINATMIDIIKAVSNQDVFMLHVVDGIEAINRDHTGTPAAERVKEGMVVAGVDPIATDMLCARYMFSNVPLKEALEVGMEDGAGGFFPQAVPIAVVEDGNIVTTGGYDCPIARDSHLAHGEERGLGSRRYHVVGRDVEADVEIVSVEGHLGCIKEGVFEDLITQTLYFDIFKFPWDMQKTAFSYMEAIDQLTGSSHKADFLRAFDEDGDGIISYNEFGKKGAWGSMLHGSGLGMSRVVTEEFGQLKAGLYNIEMMKKSDASFNANGDDLFKEMLFGASIVAAFAMSQVEEDREDPLSPGMTFGNGKWPSLQLARFSREAMSIFGEEFPERIAFPSFYGSALVYADVTQNNSQLVGNEISNVSSEIVDSYLRNVQDGSMQELDFTVYVPETYGIFTEGVLPNVEITNDPMKLFTARFNGGDEIWPDDSDHAVESLAELSG